MIRPILDPSPATTTSPTDDDGRLYITLAGWEALAAIDADADLSERVRRDICEFGGPA